jgi:hypothetical protein
MSSDIGSVTLSTTDKALYAAKDFPILGGSYFGFVGKMIRIKMFGRMTTGATPGNLTFDVYWGTGADANGTILQSSTATALVANGSGLSWEAEFDVRCTAIGSSGTLFVTGSTKFNVGLVLSTAAPILIPNATPATSSAVDLSAASIISVQAKRSGNTTETMQIHHLSVIALN